MSKIVDTIDDIIVDHTKIVILVFILLTVILGAGFTQISTDAGTSQFTEGIPSAVALENINEEFTTRSVDGIGQAGSQQTQIIQERRNVLSKNSQLEKLQLQQELENQGDFRVSQFESVASQVALTIDPEAETTNDKISAIERSTTSEIKQVTRSVLEIEEFRSIVSDEYNEQSVRAGKTISTITHEERASAGDGPQAGVEDEPPIGDIQVSVRDFVDRSDFSVLVFGDGIQSDELGSVTQDSLILVIPAAVFFIMLFLTFAYRDPFDILIGLLSLLLVIIWTFGFMGWANLPFTQILISVPPLLLAVGIDFGIHSVNRFREELTDDRTREDAMKLSNRQLFVSFALVAGSTAIGFGSNITSPLGQIQDFGIVAAIGIFFTFFVFGIFTPALKLEIDRYRDRLRIPEFGSKPLGNEDSSLGRILSSAASYNIKYPIITIILLMSVSLGFGYYATGIGSEFNEDTFLPPEETPSYISYLPVDIDEYEVPRILALIDDNFSAFGESTITIYIDDSIRSDESLQKIDRMKTDPPDAIIEQDGLADASSLVSVIRTGQFSNNTQETIDINDRSGDGIPDRNLDQVYNAIEEDPRASNFLTETRGSTRVIFTAQGDASQEEIIDAGEEISENTRFESVPTGVAVVFDEVSDFLVESTIRSFFVSILMTILFLSISYRYLESSAIVGFINVAPVLFAVMCLFGTMRLLGIPLNPITATTIGTAIGIGLDYAIHLTHRITDEIIMKDSVNEAILVSVRGTGGALLGSAITTITGIGSLYLALTPVLAEFGLIIAIGILYSFLFSMLLIPAAFSLIGNRTNLINADSKIN